MAQINAGDVKKRDLLSVFPEELIVDEKSNSRWRDVTRTRILDRAKSMVANGQEQPVVVRQVDEGRLQLVSGYTRYKAGLLINTLNLTSEPFRLDCIVRKGADGKSAMTDEEAFAHSVIENFDRDNTTELDTAKNVNVLSAHFGWTDERIAELYRVKKSDRSKWLSTMRKLFLLPRRIKDKIEDGILNVSTGLVMAEIPEDQHDVILKELETAPAVENVPEVAVAQAVGGTYTTGTEQGGYELPPVSQVGSASPAPEAPAAPVKRGRGRPAGTKKPKPAKKKAITKRALTKLAKEKGLLKGKKVSMTIAQQREFFSPIVEQAPDSKLGKLGAAMLNWLGSGDHDAFYAALAKMGLK